MLRDTLLLVTLALGERCSTRLLDGWWIYVSYCVVQEVKVSSPDYKGVELDDAVFDFKQRIESMKCEYETIHETQDRDLSFIKIYNQGEKYLVNRVQGMVSSFSAVSRYDGKHKFSVNVTLVVYWLI